jgi:catechol 2,3-dioxygenase
MEDLTNNAVPNPGPAYEVPAQTRIGHVHLQVTDLDKALGFYCGILGFKLMQRFGPQAAFISAGGYHHHIGLNTWNSLGGPRARKQGAGLYHTAILYATRAELAGALKQLVAANYPITGAADHGVSEAIYLDDPDGNGVELYWDRPQAQWPRTATGEIEMYTRALDLNALLTEAA